MKFSNPLSTKTLLFLFICIIQFSCSQDTDLFEEYVLVDVNETEPEEIIEDNTPEPLQENNDFPTINNQAVFTSSMVATLKSRIENGWAHPGGGYPDDEAYIIDQKNAFNANVNIGEWDNFNLDNGTSHGDAPIPAYGVTDEIHYAAIYSYLYSDTELAQKVVDKLISYANDPDLDISQKVRNNAFNTKNTLTTPWLFIAPRMVKFIESFALCKNLVDISQEEDDALAQWFLDWRNMFYDAANFSAEVSWGNDWQSENYTTTAYNFLVKSGNSRTNPPFTDSNGNTSGSYLTAQSQETGLNNIRCEMWAYIHAFGVYYNHVPSKEASFAFLKTWLRFNFYADGTSAELIRAKADNPQLGVSYTTVSLTAMAKAAMTQKTASLNGLTGATNGGEWLDYVTSEGTSDFEGTTNHVGTSTSGGSKSILSVVKAHLNFMRQHSGQGWSPKRYFNGSDLMDGDNKMGHRPLAAILNTYYKDDELEAGWKNDAAYGFIEPKTGSSTASYKEANNGSHGVFYGLMYWAGM